MTSGADWRIDLPDGVRIAAEIEPGGRGLRCNPGPVVLIVAGSGPVDRNADQPGQVLGIGAAFAEALAARGVGSVRFDKRGVGASGGEYAPTGFDQEADDARRVLLATAARPDVDPRRIVVLGHSAGATIAMRLAPGSELGAVVLLAGAARRGTDVMDWQTERIAATMNGTSRLFAPWFRRRQRAANRAVDASTDAVVRVGGGTMPARWLREFRGYDPSSDLRAIHCPVLAVTGSKDIQVPAADVATIGELVRGEFTGWVREGLTHLLRVDDRPAGLARYAAQTRMPVDAGLVRDVVDWIVGRVGAERE